MDSQVNLTYLSQGYLNNFVQFTRLHQGSIAHFILSSRVHLKTFTVQGYFFERLPRCPFLVGSWLSPEFPNPLHKYINFESMSKLKRVMACLTQIANGILAIHEFFFC